MDRTIEVISRFQNVHGDKYAYHLVDYRNIDTKVTVVCREHGEFNITPYHHIHRKQGCKACGVKQRGISQRKSLGDFVAEANAIHRNLYEYTSSIYTGAHSHVEIICRKHGPFLQTPRNHLNGNGCPTCMLSYRKSKAANEWLDSIPSKLVREYRLPENYRYSLDGYDPETNTAYLFHGDYWHGNPKRYAADEVNAHNGIPFGELYVRTMKTEETIRSYGYNLIVKWESD